MAKLSSKTKGVFYIILSAFGFSLMSMFVKLAGDGGKSSKCNTIGLQKPQPEISSQDIF